MSQALNGHVAVVTGGGTGIGAAIASRLACMGAAVAIGGRRAVLLEQQCERIEAAGGKAVAVPCDSATERGVEQLFDRVREAFGPVDILVNNAAIAGPVAPIWEQDLAGWEETLRINLTGPWLCARAAAKQMMPRNEGKIVNIGSMTGKRPLAKRTPYAATKLGVVGLTRTLALELGEYNISVNCISPGAVATPRLEELAKKAGMPVEEFHKLAAAGSALKRISTPEDIAGLVAYLVSPEGRNITGIDITVDAGVWYS